MNSNILRHVSIRLLFGYLNYSIDFSAEENVLLLYGENGAGKTTILRMIFAALAPNNNEGLRTYLRRLPFSMLTIEMSNGSFVSILKTNPEDDHYRYKIFNSARSVEMEIDLFRYKNDTDRGIEETRLQSILQLIRELGFDVHYLSDDRLLRSSSSYLARSIESSDEARRTRLQSRIPTLLEDARGASDRTWLNIQLTADQVTDAFRVQFLEQGNRGQRSTNHIYLDMAKRLVSEWRAQSESGDDDFHRMVLGIENLERELDQLPTLKNLVNFPSAEFSGILNGSPVDRRDDLVRILTPYLDSIRARVDALTPLAKNMGLLVDELNSFFSRKKLTFDFSNNFVVHSPQGAPIPLGSLSSGEKQIFLLMCSAVLSRRSPCVFLIDEPELSLNVYWQRSLPRTLQRLVDGGQTQYILATHSLEILTEFSEQIFSLENNNAASPETD